MYVQCKHVGHICTIQIPRVSIIFVDHGSSSPMVNATLCAYWYEYYETIYRMLFVHVEVDEYNICLDCYKNVGFYLLFISYFSWFLWTNQTRENEYSKTIFAATKHWKSFFALFSTAKPNTLKAFSLPENIFPWTHFTLGNEFI